MTGTKTTSQFIQKLPRDWSLPRFRDLLSSPLRNGIYKKKEFHGSGVKIINMGDLFKHDFISDQDMKRVEITDKERRTSLVRNGDLLFARRSYVLEGSGKCSLVVLPTEDMTFESSLIRARLDRETVEPRFYFYLFRSPLGRALIGSIATRTAVSGIRGSDLVELEIPKPPLHIQRRIAFILSAYDDLIENNLRRIKILEEVAKALYHEWFVKFRFPGHEKVRMVESSQGKIPEGWKVRQLKALADVNRTSINKRTAPKSIRYIDISSVSPGRIDHIEKLAFNDAPSRARRVVQHHDIIWSCVRPNRKSHAVVLDPAPNTVVSTGFVVISPTEIPFTCLYHAVTTEQFVSYLANRARGAAYPAVSASDFENADVLTPPTVLLERFHQIVEATFLTVHNCFLQNETLRRTRDLLLPRLISGELDVSDLDIEVGQEAA